MYDVVVVVEVVVVTTTVLLKTPNFLFTISSLTTSKAFCFALFIPLSCCLSSGLRAGIGEQKGK